MTGFLFLVELRRPEGPPSGAPYSYRKEKETHDRILSWLSWLAALLAGACARRRRKGDGGSDSGGGGGGGGVTQHVGQTPKSRMTETYSLGLP